MQTVIENLIVIIINLIITIIIVDALLSYISSLQNTKLAMLLRKISEIFLAPTRKITPKTNIGLDLTPLLAILILKIIQGVLIRLINMLV